MTRNQPDDRLMAELVAASERRDYYKAKAEALEIEALEAAYRRRFGSVRLVLAALRARLRGGKR